MLHAPKWRTKMFHRTVAVFWNIYSNTSDSSALDFFKAKELKATCHQSYSFWSSPTGPNQPPSKSHFAKHFNHQNLLINCHVYSFTHICVWVHIHTPPQPVQRRETPKNWKQEQKYEYQRLSQSQLSDWHSMGPHSLSLESCILR